MKLYSTLTGNRGRAGGVMACDAHAEFVLAVRSVDTRRDSFDESSLGVGDRCLLCHELISFSDSETQPFVVPTDITFRALRTTRKVWRLTIAAVDVQYEYSAQARSKVL